MAAAGLAGCGSPSESGLQPIFIETPGVEGAACHLEDQAGNRYAVSYTPGDVAVPRDSGPLSVSCFRAGYEPARAAVPSSPAENREENDGWLSFMWGSDEGDLSPYPVHIALRLEPTMISGTMRPNARPSTRMGYGAEEYEGGGPGTGYGVRGDLVPHGTQPPYDQNRLITSARPGGYRDPANGVVRYDPPAGTYSVQVGAFHKPDNAEKMVRKLRAKGYKPFVMEDVDRRSRPVSHVRFGSYRSLSEARKAASRYRRAMRAEAIVLRN